MRCFRWQCAWPDDRQISLEAGRLDYICCRHCSATRSLSMSHVQIAMRPGALHSLTVGLASFNSFKAYTTLHHTALHSQRVHAIGDLCLSLASGPLVRYPYHLSRSGSRPFGLLASPLRLCMPCSDSPLCRCELGVRSKEKGRAAMQKQVFVPWKGTRCFNLVAEPRLLLAFATLLIAMVAGVWW